MRSMSGGMRDTLRGVALVGMGLLTVPSLVGVALGGRALRRAGGHRHGAGARVRGHERQRRPGRGRTRLGRGTGQQRLRGVRHRRRRCLRGPGRPGANPVHDQAVGLRRAGGRAQRGAILLPTLPRRHGGHRGGGVGGVAVPGGRGHGAVAGGRRFPALPLEEASDRQLYKMAIVAGVFL